MVCCPVDPVLQLAGLAGQSVKVEADDHVDAACGDVGRHALVGRADLDTAMGGDAVVYGLLDDGVVAVGCGF